MEKLISSRLYALLHNGMFLTVGGLVSWYLASPVPFVASLFCTLYPKSLTEENDNATTDKNEQD